MINKNVREIYGLRSTKGLIGLEIEVEGDNLPASIVHWKREHDGSLRGESAEYVLNRPLSREKAFEALDNVMEAYKASGSKIKNSYRCSTHVHINVQDMHMPQVYNMILLYMMFEEHLVRYCGEHREGNLFCLRVKDAVALVPVLARTAQTGEWRRFREDILRYAAINVTSLPKYGSLEFRSMRGTDNMEEIKVWVDLLLAIKEAAQSYEDPVKIIEDISMLGPDGLADKVFGNLLENLQLEDNWEEHVFSSMRTLQILAYAPNWELSDEEEVTDGVTNREGFAFATTHDWTHIPGLDGAPRERVPLPVGVEAYPRSTTVHRVDQDGDDLLLRNRANRFFYVDNNELQGDL